MSSTIERRIVQMVFEAKEFSRGIRSSMEDLRALKKSFQMDEAQRSLSELEKASHVDFSPMGKALDSINNKMSIVGVAAAHMVTKVTDAIVGGAIKMGKALVLDPIKAGLDEYEIQLNAIQTILANTARHGTNLKDVSGALDELNTYADLTIYNFTQMVDSIGKFTTAGVDLETSVLAIKGIANIAAISGSSAQQASTAMYQLSQAIGTGSLKLQDWNSVVNAGMGGQIFQDALAETARVYGVNVDAILAKNGSFRASLQEGWVSKEILLDTLAKFTGDLSDAELEALGYTQEQIAAIQEQAQMAVDAATKIKTLTGLMDTLNEALQSGWALSWKFIFGDFNQAQVLWGQVSEFFSEMISQSSDSRNQLLGDWSALGGRTKAIEAFFNLLHVGKNILTAVGEAFKEIFDGNVLVILLRSTRLFRDWTERLRESSESLDGFKTVMKAVASIFSIIFMAVQAILKPFGLLQGITSGLGGGFMDMLVTVSEAIIKFRDMAEETDFFDKVVTSIIEHTKEFVAWIKDLVQQFKDLEIVERVVATILWVFKEIKKIDPAKVWQGFLDVLMAIVAPFYLAAKGAEWLYNEIVKLEVVQDIIEWFNDIDLNEIKQEFIEVGESIKEFIDSIKDSDIVKEFSEALNSFDIKAEFTEFIEAAKEGFGWISEGSAKAKEGLSKLIPDMTFITDAAKNLGEALKEAFSSLFDYLTGGEPDLDYDRLFKFINAGMLAGFILALRELADMFSLDTIFGDTDIGEAIVEDLESISGALDGMALGLKADALKNIAVGIALLAGSIFLLSAIPSKKLREATAAVAVMTLGLAGATRVMGGLDLKTAAANAVIMIGLGISLGLVATALIPITKVDPDRLLAGMEALGASMFGMVGSVIAITKLAGKSTDIIVIVGVMYALGKALDTLARVVQAYGEMEPETLIQGGIAVGVALAALTGAVIVVSKWGGAQGQKLGVSLLAISVALLVLGRAIEYIGKMDPKVVMDGLTGIGLALGGFAVFTQYAKPEGIIKTAIAITIISGALFLLAEAVERWAELSSDTVMNGLMGIGGALLVIVGALRLAGPTALPAAAAIGVMSLAILVLAVAFTQLSKLSWEQIRTGLAAIAITLGILTVAGYVMAPIVPVLFALGIAMGLIGFGAFLMGAGLLLAALGLVAIAGSATAIAAAIIIVGEAIIEVLPKMAKAIGEALAAFLETMAENTPIIVESMKTIILGMIQVIADLIPEVVIVILELITALLQAISDNLPNILTAGFEILTTLLKGIADNIGDVTTSVFTIITEFLEAVAEKLPDLLTAGFEVLTEFLKGIADNIADAMSAATDVITEFLDGVAKNLPKVLTAGFGILTEFLQGIADNIGDVLTAGTNLIIELIKGFGKAHLDIIAGALETLLTFLEGLEIAIDENLDKIVATGIRIGAAVVEGIITGLLSGLANVVETAKGLAQTALDTFRGRDGVEEGSPSKKTYEIAKNFVLGFVKGIEDNLSLVKAGIKAFAQTAEDSIYPLVQAMADDIDRGIEFSPVISPVLDLDNIDAGLGVLNRSFNDSGLFAELSYTQMKGGPVKPIPGINGDTSGVTFIQNNYSPKALDRETIYRQTRTQVAKLSERAFE